VQMLDSIWWVEDSHFWMLFTIILQEHDRSKYMQKKTQHSAFIIFSMKYCSKHNSAVWL
jgi:hypothetical protein